MSRTVGLTEESFRRFLTSLKDEPRARLSSGFEALTDLNEQQRSDLVEFVIRTPNVTTYGFDIEKQSFTGALGEDRARRAASAMRLLMLAILGSSPSVVIEETRKGGLVSEKVRPIVQEILKRAHDESPRIGSILRGADLAREVLPTLETFEIGIDLRLGFGEPPAAAPVVVVHIDTDANDGEIWFQMARPQAEAMVRDLKQALERLETAEHEALKLARK